MQSTIAVPIIGYMILLSERLQEFLKLTIDSSLEVTSTRLYFLYFGLSSLAIATIIFNIRCPDVVKNHRASFDYVDKQKQIVGSKGDSELIATFQEYGIQVPKRNIDTMSERSVVYFMISLFSGMEVTRPISRIVVLLFLLTGFALLTVPTVETFLDVAKLALDRIAEPT